MGCLGLVTGAGACHRMGNKYLLSFLESVPEVAAKIKHVGTKERKFDEVVKAAEEAAVLVLVY